MRYGQTFKKRAGAARVLVPGLFIPALFLFMFIFSLTPSRAGIYHAGGDETGGAGETLACGQCHTMHGTQGGVSLIYGGASQRYEKLLRAATALDLCLWCHEDPTGKWTPEPPDVMNNILPTYTPSAGDFRDRNFPNDRNRHDIERVGMDTVTPPGLSAGTWTDVTNRYGTTFNCLYCHDQHGNKNYRNLRYNPIDPINDYDGGAGFVKINFSYEGGPCSDGAPTPCDVQLTDNPDNLKIFSRSTGYVRFYVSNGNYDNRISQWCGKCHTDFYGLSGAVAGNMGGVASGVVGAGDTGTPWVRHPVGDINITLADTNLHADAVNWDADTNITQVRFAEQDWPTNTTPDNEQPFCLSCHYAHGGGNPNKDTNPNLDHSMLVFTDDVDSNPATPGNPNIEGDAIYNKATGSMRNTCNQCHNQ